MGQSETWSVQGFSNIKNLDRAIKHRNECKDHVGTAVSLKLLGGMPADKVVSESIWLHITVLHSNEDTLKCLLEATAYVGMQELIFKEHIEGASSDNGACSGDCTI